MRIVCLRLRSPNPRALNDFYTSAFDATPSSVGPTLGEERIEVLGCEAPDNARFAANETGFQHFALVVRDIEAAYARLQGVAGWRPISLAGPERLPKASGGVSAFKFRDPDGHPLELLQFPADDIPDRWAARLAATPGRLFVGVDHTGLSVRSAEVSSAFYAELGFVPGRRHVNVGLEQARLDGFTTSENVRVSILPLSSPRGTRPGIELLEYLEPRPVDRTARDHSEMATRIVIAAPSAGGVPEQDPDGHRLQSAP